MIFSFDGSDYGLDKIFHNRNIEIEEWTSKIPSIDFLKATTSDDKLMELFEKSDLYNGVSYVADKYIYNIITTSRISIGGLARSVGFLQTDFLNISNAFREPSGDMALKVINGADAIVNSELFQKGVNALGAIPIVGWIIKIIVKVAEMIYKIYDSIVKKKIQQSDFDLLNQPWVPISQFSKEADEELTKFTIDHINANDIEWCFTPRNYWEDLADFIVVREKRGEQEKLTDFYQLRSSRSTSGAGFIPGTTFLSSHVRFITKAGTVRGFPNVMDTGIFYPTVQSVCNQLYQMVQKIGPALYGINCDKLINLWENNIASLLEYEKESIRYGWTQYPTACVKEMDNDPNCNTEIPYFKCDKSIYDSGYENPYHMSSEGCNKKSQAGNNVALSTSKFSSGVGFRKYLADTYFDGIFKDKNGKPIQPTIAADDSKNIDPSQSVPSKALKVLKERQWAAINSLNCAYIADDERFPSIKGDLKEKRAKNLGILLNSSDWKRLYWRDIVDQDLRDAVASKASKLKLTYDKEGPIVKPSLNIAIPSVLGDPSPPKPFNPVGANGRYGLDSKSNNSIQSSSSILPLTLGAAGLAYLFLKK